MPLQATSGAASYDAFGGGVAAVPNYIEDVFNTYVWTGTGSNQTLTTNVDTSTYGGLFWTKNRTNVFDHALWSTNFSLSGNYLLKSNTTGALTYGTYGTGDYVSNSTTGVTVYGNSSQNYVTWTFRKQPKFFDVVTWSGTGMSVAHSLGTTPATIILKRTNAVDDWYVVHRSANGFFSLNTTNAASGTSNAGIGTDTNTAWVAATSTTCNFENFGNAAGTYVAYLFAHNAGGFGLTGTDNVISCGSYTGNGSATGPVITLGYEPQWVMIKKTSDIGNWHMHDIMRDMSVTSNSLLWANLSDAEVAGASAKIAPLATGFQITNSTNGENESGGTFIYIAIRRGPMKVPTSGTSVFSPQVQTPTGATNYVMAGSSGFPIDWLPTKQKDTVVDWYQTSRLTNNYMSPNTTAAEGAYTYGFDLMQGVSAQWNTNSTVSYAFRRAPNFFDVVCYTGTGSQQNITHNLGVAPELMIVKRRSAAGGSWATWATSLTADQSLALNTTDDKTAVFSVGFWGSTYPTSSVFTVGSNVNTNSNTVTYVAYLFATCAGVSKVFSYTGNGSSQTINCGFTAGARWILIKRTDSTGDWYVWDSARGIVSGNDPHLSLNTTAAEVTTDDTIDTDSTGFVVNQVSATNVNVSSATYIGIAIA